MSKYTKIDYQPYHNAHDFQKTVTSSYLNTKPDKFTDNYNFQFEIPGKVDQILREVRSSTPNRSIGLSSFNHVTVNHPPPLHPPLGIDNFHTHSYQHGVGAHIKLNDYHPKTYSIPDHTIKIHSEHTEINSLLNEERRKYTDLKHHYDTDLEQEKRFRNQADQRIQMLTNEIDSKNHEINDLRSNVSKAENHIRALEAEIQRLKDEFIRLGELTNSKIREMDENNNSLKHEKVTLEQRLVTEIDRLVREHEALLKSVVREWESRARQLDEQLRESNNYRQQFEKENIYLKDQFQHLKYEHEEQIRIFSHQIKEEEEKKYRIIIQDLELKLKATIDARDVLDRQYQECLRISELKEKQYADSIMVLENDHHKLKADASNLRSEISSLSQNLDRCKQELLQKENLITRIQSENIDLKNNISKITDINRIDMDRIKSEYASAKREWETNAEELRRRCTEAEQLFRQSESELAHVKSQYNRLLEGLQGNLSSTIMQTITEYRNTGNTARSVNYPNYSPSMPAHHGKFV